MDTIHCTVTYTFETILELINYVSRRKKKICNFSMVIGGIAVIVGLLFLTLIGFDLFIVSGLTIIVILNTVMALTTYVFPKKSIKKSLALNSEIRYSFDENSVEIESQGDFINEKTTLDYKAIKKVEINKNYLYLFITANSSYIVDMNRIEIYTPAYLTEFLNTKITIKK